MRTAAVKIELDRYDEMHRAIWAQATAGSLEHMAMALRISDMRNKVLGLYAPPSSNDALRNAMVAGHQSSTERIRAALQLVISQRTIDGSATEMKDVSETKDDGPTPPRIHAAHELRNAIRGLAEEEIARVADVLGERMADAWTLRARDSQLPPRDLGWCWLFVGGRGTGKTRRCRAPSIWRSAPG